MRAHNTCLYTQGNYTKLARYSQDIYIHLRTCALSMVYVWCTYDVHLVYVAFPDACVRRSCCRVLWWCFCFVVCLLRSALCCRCALLFVAVCGCSRAVVSSSARPTPPAPRPNPPHTTQLYAVWPPVCPFFPPTSFADGKIPFLSLSLSLSLCARTHTH